MKIKLLLFMVIGIIVVGSSVLISAPHLESVEEKERNLNTTKEQALNSLLESEETIEDMIENDFPVIFMEDALLMAERVFEQAQYASILREEVNVSKKEKQEARSKLELVDWEEINYDDVIFYTDQIKEREDRIFTLYDSLITAKITLLQDEGLEKSITGSVTLLESTNETIEEVLFLPTLAEGIDEETKRLFNELSIAFYEDRDDTEDLLMEFRNHLESKRLESATFNTLTNNTKIFVQRTWYFILLFLALFGTVGYLSYKKIDKRNLKKKIEKMRLDNKVILGLMKKTQIERFKENKISELIYNIRIKKYGGRLKEIKEKLPILETKLKKPEMRLKKLKE